MKTEDYNQALRTAEQEFSELLTKRAEIDKRISRLRETMSALRRLCEGTDSEGNASDSRPVAPSEERGFTVAVADALKVAGEPLRPTAVRDKLIAMGFELKGYQNPLAAIHIILKRLEKAGDARMIATTIGDKTYEWVDPTSAPSSSEVVTVNAKKIRKKRG